MHKRFSKMAPAAWFAGLAVLCLLSFAAALCLGSAGLSLRAVWGGLTQDPAYATAGQILRAVRLPRLAASVLAGAGLASSGVLLQAVTGNPLASPNIIGVNAGAGISVMLCLCFLPGAAFAWMPAAAFAGAFGTTLFLVGTAGRSRSRTTLVLAGVAVNALLNAGISFLALVFPDVYSSYAYFSAGGVSGVTLAQLAEPAVILVLAFAAAMVLAPRLDLLCLGETLAASLGVRVRPLRMITLAVSSALAAAVVSFAGLLGFVGLIVPHLTRRMVGSRLRLLLPASCLLGMALVCAADTLGRVLLAPTEIPVGIVMAVLGAPFFFFLLMKGGRHR